MSADRGADDLYAALGIPPGATEEDITRAYRRLAREHHPDANPDAQAGRFAGLTDAYEVLRDAARRRAYDDTRRARAGAASSPGGGFRVPVTSRQPPPPGAGPHPPSPVEVVLGFEQAALGATVRVTVDVDRPCPGCSGRGRSPGAGCPSCGGSGVSARTSGGIAIRTPCPACEGAGRQPSTVCAACRGTGRASGTREVPLEVPPGVEDGAVLHLQAGGPGGDEQVAVVRVQPHRYFSRQGRDLVLLLPITLAEAALGGVVTVPTLDGAVAIRIPPGTGHGRVLRVRGHGLPLVDQPGDLLATVEIVVPSSVTAEQRLALEAFAAATESPRRHFES